jgi:hypothetical protein
MTDWRLIRDQLVARCGGYCEKCGMPMRANDWAAHHRLLRAHGGAHELSNLMAVHHHCHNGDTLSIHLSPKYAYQVGFLVHNGHDPAQVPLQLPGGSWALLGAMYTPWKEPE